QGRPRYRLLEMLRAFARRRLDEAGESQETRLAHAERMVWLAERLGLNTAGSGVWVWPKVEGMADDIRAALRTLLELRPRRAAWMAGTLRWFWRGTGRPCRGGSGRSPGDRGADAERTGRPGKPGPERSRNHAAHPGSRRGGTRRGGTLCPGPPSDQEWQAPGRPGHASSGRLFPRAGRPSTSPVVGSGCHESGHG